MKKFSFFSLILFVFMLPNVHAQLDSWTYIQIDNSKTKWGDYEGATPEWLRYFGLDMRDVNNDGLADVLSGRWIYLNPGGDLMEEWKRVDLGVNVDGILIMDVDNDEFADVIGQALPDVLWLEATNTEGTEWSANSIGQIPETSHRNSQGFSSGQIIAGGKPEFVIAGDGNIYSFEVPKNPNENEWQITLVTANTSDEGIGLGDIDNDGDLDIAAGRRPDGEYEPKIVVWHQNPGDGSGEWPDYEIGETNHPADRFGVADLDGDNKPDIVVCEERYPGKEPDGNLFWYKQPEDNAGEWERRHIVTQFSMNNLSLSDIDGDGDIDIITAEHKGKNLELQIWENDGFGNFEKTIVDKGKESHLGTQLVDIDNDGDLDIVSTGWDRHEFVHLWRNDN